jgi:predicted enzyme related to lactoylglutathione lyase
MGAPVVHWEINAKDGRRAQEFYASLFDWKVDASNPMNYGLTTTGTKLGINGGIGQQDLDMQTPAVTFYVGVDDLQSYLDRVEGMGGRVVKPVTEIPGMVTFALFADPEGNIIGLLKNMPPPRAARPKRARKPAKKAAKRKAKAKAKPKGRKARRRR